MYPSTCTLYESAKIERREVVIRVRYQDGTIYRVVLLRSGSTRTEHVRAAGLTDANAFGRWYIQMYRKEVEVLFASVENTRRIEGMLSPLGWLEPPIRFTRG